MTPRAPFGDKASSPSSTISTKPARRPRRRRACAALLLGASLGACSSEEGGTSNFAGEGPTNGIFGKDGNDGGPSSEAPPNLGPISTNPPNNAKDPSSTCETVEAVAQARNPDILIALDRSGSMAGERWQVASKAVAGAVTSLAQKAQFGLALFPAVGHEVTCQAGPVAVLPSANTAATIASMVGAKEATVVQDYGYTPTRVTLQRALQVLTPNGSGAPRSTTGYVLLVTDGKPNCPAVGDKGASDETATYAALDALRAANIKTYVVGYLTQNMALVMDEMARRGGTEKHYAVSNANDIVKAIGLVTSSVAPCSFTLSKTPAGPQYVQVTVDGADVPLDPVQGWSLQNSTTVAFNGKACEALRDGKDHPIRIAVTCEPVKPR